MYVHCVRTVCVHCISEKYVGAKGKYELLSTCILYVRMCTYVCVRTFVYVRTNVRSCTYVRASMYV
jgi:hypothetical protein